MDKLAQMAESEPGFNIADGISTAEADLAAVEVAEDLANNG